MSYPDNEIGLLQNIRDLAICAAVQEAPLTGAAAIAASDTVLVVSARYLVIVCTVAGNVKVKFSDGSTLTVPVNVGLTIFPWAVIQVFVTGTTATATYANLS